MPYLRQRSLTGIPASASFKIATIWLSVMRLLIVKLLCFSLKEILRVGCIILRGSYIRYPAYLFAILLIVSIACLVFIAIIHFFVPKIMIKTYFKEPYFSALEIKLFTGPPYAYMRTAMMMRLAGWPDCGKKRGIPATAHEICPVWFQVVSRLYLRFSVLVFTSLVILSAGFFIVSIIFGGEP